MKYKLVCILLILFLNACIRTSESCISNINYNKYKLIGITNSLTEAITEDGSLRFMNYYYITDNKLDWNGVELDEDSIAEYLSKNINLTKKQTSSICNSIKLLKNEYCITGITYNDELETCIYRFIDIGAYTSHNKYICIANENIRSKLIISTAFNIEIISEPIYLLKCHP